MKKKRKMIDVYKDGKLFKRYESIMDVVCDLRVSYPSVEKSARTGAYIKGYIFSYPKQLEAVK